MLRARPSSRHHSTSQQQLKAFQQQELCTTYIDPRELDCEQASSDRSNTEQTLLVRSHIKLTVTIPYLYHDLKLDTNIGGCKCFNA